MTRLIFAIITATVFTSASNAAPITYDFSYAPDSQGRTAFGSITTDGHLGALLPSDILGWSTTIVDPNRTFFGNHAIGGVFSPTDSGISMAIDGDVIATSSFLYVPTPNAATSSIPQVLNALVLYDNGFALQFTNSSTWSQGVTGWNQTINVELSGPDGLIDQYLVPKETNVPLPQLIISANVTTPEPSSVILALMGFAALLAYRWRK